MSSPSLPLQPNRHHTLAKLTVPVGDLGSGLEEFLQDRQQCLGKFGARWIIVRSPMRAHQFRNPVNGDAAARQEFVR